MGARSRVEPGRSPERGASPESAAPAAIHEFVVTAAEAGARLDVFLTGRLPGRSRSEIQRLIRDGHVTVPRGRFRSGTPVPEGLPVRVTIPAPRPARPEPEDLPLTVLYDDEDVVVIDKPAGMVVHPGAGHRQGTVVNALLHHVGGLSGVGGEERPGVVHRLDRGTSGVMVVAKHDRAHRDLAAQFHDRTVEKEYFALVWGRPVAGQRFDQPIGRDPRHRQRMSSRARRARSASTRVVSVEPLGEVSLVALTIGTGRTHQIRVHLSEAGHPVVGDPVYGGGRRKASRIRPAPDRTGAAVGLAGLSRPFLHAASLTFSQPTTKARLRLEAPLPPDLAALVEALRERAR